MKKSIALAALLVALGTSVFAATTVKTGDKSTDEISFVQLKTDNGFGVKIDKETAGKSVPGPTPQRLCSPPAEACSPPTADPTGKVPTLPHR